jgi:hypothetical protein
LMFYGGDGRVSTRPYGAHRWLSGEDAALKGGAT